jgi:hypothetical protein
MVARRVTDPRQPERRRAGQHDEPRSDGQMLSAEGGKSGEKSARWGLGLGHAAIPSLAGTKAR